MTDLEELLARHVASGTAPGIVALRGRDEPEVVAAGRMALDGPPMRADAIFRVQSMTKAIEAVAALRLVEAGRIDLDTGIETWLPELAERRVLLRPDGPLEETRPAVRPITVRHLLTNTAGWGMILRPSPLQDAMAANGTEVGVNAVAFGPDEWLARIAELPLAFQPGEGWRYHHSFSILGILLSRVAGRPLGNQLAEDLFSPLGMVDTGFTVSADRLDRLPAAYQEGDGGLVEVEPAGAGFYAHPPFDTSHAELVSTVTDYRRFVAALLDGSLISAEHRRQMLSDQVPDSAKTEDSFFPGFWGQAGWGFGVCVQPSGRWGWSGGLGTDFWVDPDQTVGILMTQVALGGRMSGLLEEFQQR